MKSLKKLYQFGFHYLFYFWFTLFICGPVLIACMLVRAYGMVAWLQHIWGWGFFVLGMQKVSIEGHREAFDTKKPYLVVCNHSSMMDIPMIAALVKTPSSWVLKDAMLKLPLMGRVFRMGWGIPIPRSDMRASQKKLMEGIEKIRRINPSILIYPEGTRSPSGKVADFKRGFIKILKAYHMDVLPVSLIGFHDYMPVGTLWTNPDASLRAYVHPPVPWEKLANMDEKEAAAKIRALVASKLPPEFQ